MSKKTLIEALSCFARGLLRATSSCSDAVTSSLFTTNNLDVGLDTEATAWLEIVDAAACEEGGETT